jgi:hypothetical protein
LATGTYGDTADVATRTRARARLAEAQASLVEAKNARLRGSLLEAEAVQREWSSVCRDAIFSGGLIISPPEEFRPLRAPWVPISVGTLFFSGGFLKNPPEKFRPLSSGRYFFGRVDQQPA